MLVLYSPYRQVLMDSQYSGYTVPGNLSDPARLPLRGTAPWHWAPGLLRGGKHGPVGWLPVASSACPRYLLTLASQPSAPLPLCGPRRRTSGITLALYRSCGAGTGRRRLSAASSACPPGRTMPGPRPADTLGQWP